MPDEQVLAWLKAKARATDAEEELSDMLDKAERLLRSLREQPLLHDWVRDKNAA